MKNASKIALTLVVLTSSMSAMAIRESEVGVRKIDCKISGETINGIREIHFAKQDHLGAGIATVVRDDKSSRDSKAFMTGELNWYESENLAPGANYSVEDFTTLVKSRENGVSKFALQKVRRTLSGPHCDGYHACEVELTRVKSVPADCTDTHDSLPPAEPRGCDPSEPWDC